MWVYSTVILYMYVHFRLYMYVCLCPSPPWNKAVPLYLCGAKVDVDYSRNQRDQWKDRPQDSRDWVCFKVLSMYMCIVHVYMYEYTCMYRPCTHSIFLYMHTYILMVSGLRMGSIQHNSSNTCACMYVHMPNGRWHTCILAVHNVLGTFCFLTV